MHKPVAQFSKPLIEKQGKLGYSITKPEIDFSHLYLEID